MRKEYLTQLRMEKEKILKTSPEGLLRVCCHGNRTQYYLRNNPKDFNGVYIPRKNEDLVRKLAQKDYDARILKNAEKEIKVIEEFLSHYPSVCVEQIYENLHKERRKMIRPIKESIEEYVYNWENVEYQGKFFDDDIPEIYTAKGERVRSKSEMIIADLLNGEKIPYRYEYPIRLKGWGKVYPDFIVLSVKKRKEIYWEHFGMMDDSDYVEKALNKILHYEENGIFQGENLIITYETRKNPINQKHIKRIIQRYLV